MTIEQKILICFNEPIKYYSNYIGKEISDIKEDVDLSEREFLTQIENIKKVLGKKYYSVDTLAINGDIRSAIKKIFQYSPDAILNFVESVEGNSRMESYMAGIYDLLEIPYTGNTSVCLGNCLNKTRTKQILQSYGIKTPKHMTLEPGSYPSREKLSLKFPLILKLAKEDASIGISEFSVVKDFDEAMNRFDYLFKNYNQEVLVEEYIEGRELNVAILGDKILPISEIRFDRLPANLPKIITCDPAKHRPAYYRSKMVAGKCLL